MIVMFREKQHDPDDQNKLDDIRWMIEEYRVSLFAQSLGTKISVSSKRIRNAIDRLTA